VAADRGFFGWQWAAAAAAAMVVCRCAANGIGPIFFHVFLILVALMRSLEQMDNGFELLFCQNLDRSAKKSMNLCVGSLPKKIEDYWIKYVIIEQIKK
jgi:hypothetical protein